MAQQSKADTTVGAGRHVASRSQQAAEDLEKLELLKKGCVFLKISYRAHPRLVNLYSSLFYNNATTSCVHHGMPEAMLEFSQLSSWSHLRTNPDFPFLFHHVEGKEDRDYDSPSWFNTEEIEVVWSYLQSLFNEFGEEAQFWNQQSQTAYTGFLKPENVGVIAPYHKQVQKLKERRNLRGRELHVTAPSTLKIGTVENFQGQENDVIFMSTVRSRFLEEVKQDLRMTLGFVGSRQRLNVALSRARKLLVIVGNAKLLSQDRSWNVLLRIACRCGAVRGGLREDDLIEHQKSKTVEEFDKELLHQQDDATDFFANCDLPWRNEEQI
ncbi:unnamed protein product [Amoebophrya sp. A25]|nr:unnamed protein product [Amoebophrya sp. A25]|eukprot:GSA25T00026296001.1